MADEKQCQVDDVMNIQQQYECLYNAIQHYIGELEHEGYKTSWPAIDRKELIKKLDKICNPDDES